MNTWKIVRAIAGVAVVVALGYVVWNWYGEFQTARDIAAAARQASLQASATVAATSTATPGTVKISGVNFREKPSSGSKLIRALKQGEKVTILVKEGQWYKIKDSKGKTGWVTSNSDYVAPAAP